MIALVADTDRNMAADTACGMNTTQAGARIHTSLVLTSKLCWAVIVENAFWVTVWRGTNHSCLTRAITAISISSWGGGIRSTWIGYARILFNNRLNR